MKKLALLFLLLSSLISFSQLSNKHWIPPLHSRDISSISDQYIYMSTNETTPFLITATDGSGNPYPGSPFTISASTPVSFTIGTSQPSKMFLSLIDVNTVVSDKGIILEGSKDFYVSFRMRSVNNAETIISKGRPGIGTSFRLGSLINETIDTRKNFVASVMATENNTTITLSDYNSNVVFSSGTGLITADSQTFTLNTGQSIVFTGYCNVQANTDGMIGGLVTSNKPVAVNSGNALGGVDNGKADLTLEQIVSATHIGTEYIFIEGNGISTMENPLIIADQNNTSIYINGSDTPAATINAGQYYLVPNSYYQGTNNRNIYIKASKPVFAYQFLGGGSNTATSGLNFIPPLSCFFQNSVNIPFVNQIGSSTYTADLMILTNSNATITINGVVVPTSQAQAVMGNTDWVTYRVANQSGNLNVVATGPLAVGVFGYQGAAAGFAGYYSGFENTPQDTNVTICSNSTLDLFNEIDGNPGNGGTWTVPSGGSPLNGNLFDPAINLPGDYIYTFTKSCNTSLFTISVKVNVAIQQITPTFNQFEAICKGESINPLPTTSNNGITGTWSPAINNSETTTYTFTPDPGQCAATTTQTITITMPKVTSEISFEVPVATLPSVIIGTQVWTSKNLDVATYRDGTPIPQVTDPTEWTNLTTGAWCYYNNDPANGSIYGKLYNAYAVNDPRGLAPVGYHIASDIEWNILTDFLGGESQARIKLKETGTQHWIAPNSNSTNEVGFSALPAGCRFTTGGFYDFTYFAYWWTSSTDNTWNVIRSLSNDNSGAYRNSTPRSAGLSVRLIKD